MDKLLRHKIRNQGLLELLVGKVSLSVESICNVADIDH